VLLALKLFAALLTVALIVAFVLYRVDESRVGNTSVPVGTARGVQIARVVYHSSIANLLRRLTTGQLYAITFWNRIYVSSDYLVPSGIWHETEHVRQWHQYGRVGFPVRYLLELFRKGYRHNRFEYAARVVAGQEPYLR
jgi:hypothetical protein